MLASTIFEKLLNDPELADMLATIDGIPAVFQTWAEPDLSLIHI